MRNNKYIHYLACILLLGLFASCEKEFLDRPPQSQIVDANFYQTNEQVLAGTAPLYNLVWFAYNDKASHGIGDARAGILTSGSYQRENVQMNTTAVTPENGSSWRAFYNVVGQANTLIQNVNTYAGEAVSEDYRLHAIAEARFMRGVAYSYLVQNWGPVPIITNNTTLLQDTTIARNTVESIWEFIIRDITFATENLPESPIQVGRLDRWAAEGMLAKMYLTRAGLGGTRNQADLDQAAYYARRAIDNSGASLMENYEDLFLTRNNNNQESLFALQWNYLAQPYGSQNSVQAFLAFGSAITGFDDGWGGDLGASRYILDKYERGDERRKATFMFPQEHYDYISQNVDGDIVDLVVPIQGGPDEDGNRYNPRAWVKKYVVGRPEDNDGRVRQQATEINTYMLRLADVYLIYAEAILDQNPEEALTYLNLVRERAGLEPKESITWDDIFNERLVEFAMEGQAWYDFVRLQYYDPQRAYQILSSQDRDYIRVYPIAYQDQEIDGREVATAWEVRDEPEGNPALQEITVNEGNFFIPIPAQELSRAPNLRKPPVPYNFNEEE